MRDTIQIFVFFPNFPLFFRCRAIRFKRLAPFFYRFGRCSQEYSDFTVLIERVGGEILTPNITVIRIHEDGFGMYDRFLGCSGIDSYIFEARYRLGIGCHFGWIRHADDYRNPIFYFLRKDTEDTIVSEILGIDKNLR